MFAMDQLRKCSLRLLNEVNHPFRLIAFGDHLAHLAEEVQYLSLSVTHNGPINIKELFTQMHT